MTIPEQRIAQDIRRFDPISLLQVLVYHGYSLDDILFISNDSTCSQSRLINSIKFRRNQKKAVITLNLGLLGGQSLLPSYFFKQVDYGKIEARKFAEFFGYFDDRLLRRFLFAVYPEFDAAHYERGREPPRNNEIFTLKLNNPFVLHWLLQLVCPELQVRVEKAVLERRVELGAIILGEARLGYESVFGKKLAQTVPGLRITLIADEENCNAGKPWPKEIDSRLQKLIFPLLRAVGIDLEIWLVIRTKVGWLRLAQGAHLGYENIRSDKPRFRRIRIFAGRLFDW
ncbi:hypothetical protein F6R98_00400 [Candidatus Methylospira mobilis]|uniref:Type VI secretion system baseplate subunit TssG n=1 Tax=Candidatus Methylospira mobilis TaxID=1808979 RepID=A0A5Q0BGB9_9GAMM|nr:hypothetical protein [Candidatus Methylospira mobilis]QFY41261.1 hypothetical protein F6R98_00400 [Candidatus Methylospira mobilis]WNV05517.1 hypothetical protein RP726_03645 [Candidatus Methylospira mobilis]